jgi:Transglycosylase SLT domain
MPVLSNDLIEREKSLSGTIEKYAKLFEIDPNVVRALMTQESAFVAEATSPTGAYGYGQFTGIGARQVYQNISQMDERAADLADFRKNRASEVDMGIKAICATLWWLYYKKYADVEDPVVKLEAVLTFYNSGGKPAALVVRHGGHAKALPFIKQLPRNVKSQSEKYAPHVAAWYLKWHELYKEEDTAAPIPATARVKPDNNSTGLDVRYGALIEALKLLGSEDETVDVLIDSRDGLTELTIILPGEYK